MRVGEPFIYLILLLLFLTTVCSPANAISTENVLGLGFGLPYGGVGVNYEIGLHDYFAPTAGIGYLPENVGWNVGVRFYYPGRDSALRGRVTGLYGTNTLLKNKRSHDNDYDTRNGFSGGIGLNWRFSESWAFDSDLFLIDSDVPDGYEEKGSDVKASLGFSYRW